MMPQKKHTTLIVLLWILLILVCVIAVTREQWKEWLFASMLANGMFQLMIATIVFSQNCYKLVRFRYWNIVSGLYSLSYLLVIAVAVHKFPTRDFIRFLTINVGYCMFLFAGGYFVLTRFTKTQANNAVTRYSDNRDSDLQD